MYYLMSFYLMIFSLMLFLGSIIFVIMKMNFLISWLLIKMFSYKIEFIIFLDWVVLMFLSVVLLISSMVLIYSIEYMKGHIYLNRFMLLITIFFISMGLMIMSPNMFSILLGWDGLGLSSYCLIIFYQNKNSVISGMVTLLMNRVGDIMILIMISVLFNNMTFNFLFINKMSMNFIFLVIAAMTKSAQIPFSTWLPMAMAAPTPVSSLVHSSTLVTAGVYLLIRFSSILNNELMFFLMIISCWTMFMSSVSALFEFDLKKIIALSTLSQLGFMVLTISVSMPLLSYFHLLTHAMFKSLMFLCSGIIIHNYFNNQDIRFITFTSLNMPIVAMIFNTASLSLCGMPFLSGFYSKDLMIEMYNMSQMNFFIYFIMNLSMMLTVLYSLRLVFYITLNPLKIINFNFFSSSNLMIYSIYMLFLFTIFYGSMMNWLVLSAKNFVILIFNKKLMIYYLILMGSVISLKFYLIKFKLSMDFLADKSFYINLMMMLQVLWKKNKINIYYYSANLLMLKELGWLEFLSCQKLLFKLINLNSFKYTLKLNFSLMMILIAFFMIVMFL